MVAAMFVHMRFHSRLIAILTGFLVLAPLGFAAMAQERAGQTVVHVLDYIASDYGSAVDRRRVKNEGEYKEMLELTAQVTEQLRALPARAERAELANDADRLSKLVAQKADSRAVAEVATRMRKMIIDAYNIPLTPAKPPDVKRGTALYAQSCAACHGVQGRGDGPAARAMVPAPANFHDRERMAKRDALSLYNTITLGISGTPMRAFPELSEEDRWALAYVVSNMAAPQSKASAIVHAREALRQSTRAYAEHDITRAQQLAVSAYLDGFELVEPAVEAVDANLRLTIERDMLQLRTLLRDHATVEAVRAHVERLDTALARTQDALAGTTLSAPGAALSSFVILMREGLEGILVLAAIIAFLVKANRRDALVYIHAGWLAALVLGVLTWVVASYALAESGAGREMTEGVTALFATVILLYVGWWLHDKSHARAWNQFIRERLAGALSRGTIWALASLSFLAIYREVFETVLFYEALWAQSAENAAPGVLSGFAAGAIVLSVVAWLVFHYGVRLPIGLFFGVSSAFLAVLAIVFAGQGVGALQAAGVIEATLINFPRIPSLGIFPTIQSLLAQVVVVAAILTVVFLKKKGRSTVRM